MEERKWYKSRKFWISVAACAASISTSIAGLATDNQTITTVGIVCGVVSAAIYAAVEAYVDAKSVESTQSRTTMTITGHSATTKEER